MQFSLDGTVNVNISPQRPVDTVDETGSLDVGCLKDQHLLRGRNKKRPV